MIARLQTDHVISYSSTMCLAYIELWLNIFSAISIYLNWPSDNVRDGIMNSSFVQSSYHHLRALPGRDYVDLYYLSSTHLIRYNTYLIKQAFKNWNTRLMMWCNIGICRQGGSSFQCGQNCADWIGWQKRQVHAVNWIFHIWRDTSGDFHRQID